MRLTLCLASLLFLMCGLTAVVTEVGSLRGFVYGTEPGCAYDNWVSHISEGQVSWLNVYAPWDEQDDEFGDYRIPTPEELRNWDSVIADFLALDLEGAQTKLNQFGYPFEVVQFQDLDSGRNLYLIREILNDDVDTNATADPADDETGSFDYGWGLYIYDPYASRPILLTAVHPADDYPSPVFALESFLDLDARFLLIAGAGREVAYIPPYNSNNQSLSDPSRFADHPFNIAYQRCADQIRALTGKLEFSLQIHSYDWNKYPGQPNVMLSAGNGRNYPALPIRDDSRASHDLINHTPFLIHPANSLGTHSEVDILDYYCVRYASTVPVIYHQEGQNVTVPYNYELPGAEFNQQMLYTAPQNLYDVYSPFLHVEMDELPKCYERTEANWRWFYGYDAENQAWDLSQRYTRFMQFYRPFLNALHEVVDSMLVLDDGTGPSNPENLRLTALGNSNCVFAWDRSYCYDFDSYVINLRYEQDGAEIHQTFDRNTNPDLAWQNTSSYTLDLGAENRLYYLRIQARDKHGNSSPYSNEVKVWKLLDPITEFTATEGDGMVDLSFSRNPAMPLGFNIYRAAGNGDFTLLASWLDVPDLVATASFDYTFLDQSVENGVVYRYQVSAEYTGNSEVFHWRILTASPFACYSLTLQNVQNEISQALLIGVNPLATDGWDSYDVERESTSGPLVIVTPPLGDSDPFSQDVRAPFDPELACKVWPIQYRSQYTQVPLVLTADPNLLIERGDLLLYDVERDHWHDLRAAPYSWQSNSSAWQNLRFYWGFQPPNVQFPSAPDVLQWLGNPLDLHWEVINRPRVQAVDIYLVSAADTLVIETGLPPQLTQWAYTPQSAISGAQLAVLLHGTDGSQSWHFSQQRSSVIPSNMVYERDPGYSLLSFPIPGFQHSVAELLGSAASAWTLGPDSLWLPAQTLHSGTAYLIWHPQAFQLNIPASIPVAAVAQNLQPGWNLVPNLLCYAFELSELCFLQGASQRSYADLVADSLLSPRVYLLGSQGFSLADHLPPGQSALLFYNGAQPLSVVFDPWFHAGETIAWADQWQVALDVSDGFHSSDSVQMGTADLSSAGFDPLFDLPKAPAFPDTPYRLALLPENPPEWAPEELQCEYRGLYPWYNEAEKAWQFQLAVNDLRPLRIKLSSSELPPGYSCELLFQGQSVFLEDGGQFWFDPPATGLFTGYLVIRSYLPQRDLVQKSSVPGIHPNPFRDQVSIALTDWKGKEADVAVYNLRGQKIRQLHSGIADSASLTLHWDGLDEHGKPVAAGVYLLRVPSQSGSVSRKLVKF